MSTPPDDFEDRAAAKMVRAAFIILGHITITEQTQAEVDWNLSRAIRDDSDDDFDDEPVEDQAPSPNRPGP